MARTKELINHITEFINIYTLILGAILVILGVQFIFAGIALGSPDIIFISLIFIFAGAVLVSLMLKDKIYQKVFYAPAYPPQYPRTRYPQQSYPSHPSHYAQTQYSQHPSTHHQQPQHHHHPDSHDLHEPDHTSTQFRQPPQSLHHFQGTQYEDQVSMRDLQQGDSDPISRSAQTKHSPPIVAEEYSPENMDHPEGSDIHGENVQPTFKDRSQKYGSNRSIARANGTIIPGDNNEPQDSWRDEYQYSSHDPKLIHPEPAITNDPNDQGSAQGQYQSADTSNPIPSYYQQNLNYSQSSQYHAPPQGAQGYYPPYYSADPQQYNTPYLGVPYYTYVQYFRETLSIPQIRSLLKVFIIAIVLGSIILILGEPFIFLFPIFFIIAFSFPSFIWISYVYNKDVLEPESKHAIFLTLAWGMFSTLFVLFPNVITEYYYGFIVAAVIVAPLNEEFFKPLGIRKVTNEINSELDGLIYGVTCGMGFAIIENFMYELGFLFNDESPIVVWTLGSFIRGIGSTIIHAVGAGLIGFTYARNRIEKMYGKSQRSPSCSKLYNLPIPAAFLVAVAIHAAWNGSAAILSVYGSNPGIIILAIAGHVTVFLLAFHIIKCLANEGFRRDMERHGNEAYTNPQIYQYN